MSAIQAAAAELQFYVLAPTPAGRWFVWKAMDDGAWFLDLAVRDTQTEAWLWLAHKLLVIDRLRKCRPQPNGG